MFTLTQDQVAIVDAVRDFATDSLAPHAAEWDETHHFPVDVFREAGAMGLGGIYADEKFGGSGLSRSEAVRIFEELAKGDTTIAAYISIHNMVVWMIDGFGDDRQRAEWVPGLASMESLGSYCLTEPGMGSDAAALRTRADRVGDQYVLNGVKQFISGAGAAAYYVVMARTAETGSHGISAIVVPGDAEGLGFGPLEKKMGWHAQPTRQVIFDNVHVPVGNRLGEEGDGFGIAMNALNGGRLNMGACSIGGGQFALDRSVAYLKTREAFGGPLIEKQALLFQLADMRMELEAARTLLWRAADALDRKDDDLVPLCAMAKRVATDAGFNVANAAIQLHGGYGYLSEYGLERVVRDLRVHQILEGTNEIMRLIVGRDLAGSVIVAGEPLDDEVLVQRAGALGRLVLNRPRAINALNHPMVHTLAAALAEWQADDAVRTVLLSGAGDRGLCAGGDIVAIYHAVREGSDVALRFWADEYALDAAIARYPKPFVSLMDGLVLGGGIGLSAHGGIRVVTERTRVGMPEVSIGFFPDVGGTYLLARSPGELGTHLALTGGTASGADAIAIGFADHFVPSDRLAELASALETRDADEALTEFAITAPASELLAHRSWIDELYAGDDAEAIVERLTASSEPAAREAAATIRSKSPTSVALTLAALRRAAALPSLEAALDQDYRVAARVSHGTEMVEGIRAQVIDKDRAPRWSPATLAEVTAATIDRYFAPLADGPAAGAELGLATPARIGSES